ncbi:Dynein heavy chain 7, axonemal [Coelomomyces lativittatus]|nr:Dynein heavy chain 7, axonemal [Coelomomyces lativittatus]
MRPRPLPINCESKTYKHEKAHATQTHGVQKNKRPSTHSISMHGNKLKNLGMCEDQSFSEYAIKTDKLARYLVPLKDLKPKPSFHAQIMKFVAEQESRKRFGSSIMNAVSQRLEQQESFGMHYVSEEDKVSALYQILKKSIQEQPVFIQESHLLLGIISRIPKHLRELYPSILAELIEDVEAHWNESNKETSLQSVLLAFPNIKDPNTPTELTYQSQPGSLDALDTLDAAAVQTTSGVERTTFEGQKQKIEKKLYITHPSIKLLNESWAQIESEKVFNFSHSPFMVGPYRFSVFKSFLIIQSEKAREKLLNGWYKHIVKDFHDALVAKKQNFNTPELLISCANTVISNQMISSLFAALHSYISLFSNANNSTTSTFLKPSFSVAAYLSETTVAFEPPLLELKDGILQGLDYIRSSMDVFPSLEALLKADNFDDLFTKKNTTFGHGFPNFRIKIQESALLPC